MHSNKDLLKPRFITLVSSDEYEFHVDQRVAKLCEHVADKLMTAAQETGRHPQIHFENIRGEILEVILQYLHFKHKFMNTNFTASLPPFYMKPELALDVLNASLFLKM